MAKVIRGMSQREKGLLGKLKTEDLVRGVDELGNGSPESREVLKILKRDLGEEDDLDEY